jgi:hypothetical protein
MEGMRRVIEAGGDGVSDLHVWRLGPGHLAAIVSVVTPSDRDAHFYRGLLGSLPSISHLTVEVTRTGPTHASRANDRGPGWHDQKMVGGEGFEPASTQSLDSY